jgi:predicted metal-dependent hydrolase
MKQISSQTIDLGPRRVDYWLLNSKAAQKIRVRVGPNGVQVIKPIARDSKEVVKFLRANEAWILNQLEKLD